MHQIWIQEQKHYGVLHYIYIEKCYTNKQITKLWLQAQVAYECEEREEKK